MTVFAGAFELSNLCWGLEWSMCTAPLAPCCSRSIFQEYPSQAKGVPPTAWSSLAELHLWLSGLGLSLCQLALFSSRLL